MTERMVGLHHTKRDHLGGGIYLNLKIRSLGNLHNNGNMKDPDEMRYWPFTFYHWTSLNIAAILVCVP